MFNTNDGLYLYDKMVTCIYRRKCSEAIPVEPEEVPPSPDLDYTSESSEEYLNAKEVGY